MPARFTNTPQHLAPEQSEMSETQLLSIGNNVGQQLRDADITAGRKFTGHESTPRCRAASQ